MLYEVITAGVNTALCPAGKPVRSAVSDVIASPSASLALTFTVNSTPSVPDTLAGATTTGAWSTLLTSSAVTVAGQGAVPVAGVDAPLTAQVPSDP